MIVIPWLGSPPADLPFLRSFDFFYLPIDFRNKCNVGYMFINFLEHGFAEESARRGRKVLLEYQRSTHCQIAIEKFSRGLEKSSSKCVTILLLAIEVS